MAPRRQKNRVSAHTLRKRVDAAMTDFTRPTLDEMLEEGNRLFKPLLLCWPLDERLFSQARGRIHRLLRPVGPRSARISSTRRACLTGGLRPPDPHASTFTEATADLV
jgi:hypothetical protein